MRVGLLAAALSAAVLTGCGSGGVSAMPPVAPLGLTATCADWNSASADRQRSTARADLAALEQIATDPNVTGAPPSISDDEVTRTVPLVTDACAKAGSAAFLERVFAALPPSSSASD